MPANWQQVQPPPQEPRRERPQNNHDGAPNDQNRLRGEKTLIERMEQFEVETPQRSLERVVLNDVTRQELHAVLMKLHHRHLLYEEWGLKEIDPHGGRAIINLYGPPGTGKSLVAEAIAHHLRMPIVRVSYAEIESKFVGETPKNIKAAFAKAKEVGAVLFWDEADSILGKRLTNVTQSADHGVNVSRSVMLLELDKWDGVTIFATNLARNYDGAFRRRILAHIEMPLPDAESRQQLWSLHLPGRLPLGTIDWTLIIQESEGLAGGDILNAVILSASNAVLREDTRQRRVLQDDILTALASIKKAKQQVGSDHDSEHLKITQMPLQQAPESVIRAAQKKE